MNLLELRKSITHTHDVLRSKTIDCIDFVILCFTPSVATRRFPRLSARLGRECVTENWLYREGERQNAIIC